MVGATRESVNKIIKTYKQKALIDLTRGYLTILDDEGLRRSAR